MLWRECLYREPALRFIRDVGQVNPNPLCDPYPYPSKHLPCMTLTLFRTLTLTLTLYEPHPYP